MTLEELGRLQSLRKAANYNPHNASIGPMSPRDKQLSAGYQLRNGGGYAPRYAKRLLTSIPYAAEEAVVAAMAPQRVLQGVGATAQNLWGLYKTQGKEGVRAVVDKKLSEAFSSPEAAADLTVDLALTAATRKPKVFSASNLDEAGIAGVAAGQAVNAATSDQSKPPPPLGSKLKAQLAEGTDALIAAGEKDPRFVDTEAFAQRLEVLRDYADNLIKRRFPLASK